MRLYPLQLDLRIFLPKFISNIFLQKALAIFTVGTITIQNVFAITEDAQLTASDAPTFFHLLSPSPSQVIQQSLARPVRGRAVSVPGSAYIFTRDGAWTEQTKLTASDGAAFDAFGISASFSDGTAIIGALRDDDMGTRSGAAYI